MQSARKIESFCVEPGERYAFAGDFAGKILVVPIDSFTVLGEVQAHAGTIIAMAAHPNLPYIAALAQDRMVSVWRYNEHGHIFPVAAASIRDVRPSNDDVDAEFIQSGSQALAFHDTERRIVTRSGNAGVLELEFEDDGTIRLLRCVRVHREWDLISTRYVHNADAVLSGSVDGELVLSEAGEVLRRWWIGSTAVHWCEHVAGGVYLVASDNGFVARIDLESDEEPLIGPRFTRDDLEHVSYNRASGRFFVSSFDRDIYEVDPRTCAPLGVVYHAPFKCRWLATLERLPAIAIVQVRDGALQKVNVDTGECLAEIKDTAEALWTSVTTESGELLLAGEGESLLRLRVTAVERRSRVPVFAVERTPLDIPHSYTKRMVLQHSSGRLILGRTDGTLLVRENGTSRSINVGSAIRDLAVHPDRPELFLCCENGQGHMLDLDTMTIVRSFSSPSDLPLWSLAYNPERNLVAFLERHGLLTILNADDFTMVAGGFNTRRAKRAKWVDADRLLFSQTGQLDEVNVVTGERRVRAENIGNSIEDFIWDGAHLYLVLIAYTTNIQLHDFESGQLLSVTPDQMDYSKGLTWVPWHREYEAYPLDFITFGRSGCAHLFRIHNERVLPLGPVGHLAREA